MVSEKVPSDREATETAESRTKRAAEEVARARGVIQTARERFAAGDHAAAIALLEAFQPASLVVNALAGFRADIHQVERRRLEQERLVVQPTYENEATAAPVHRTQSGAPIGIALPPENASTTPGAAPAAREPRRGSRAVTLAIATIAILLAAIVWIVLNLR